MPKLVSAQKKKKTNLPFLSLCSLHVILFQHGNLTKSSLHTNLMALKAKTQNGSLGTFNEEIHQAYPQTSSEWWFTKLRGFHEPQKLPRFSPKIYSLILFMLKIHKQKRHQSRLSMTVTSGKQSYPLLPVHRNHPDELLRDSYTQGSSENSDFSILIISVIFKTKSTSKKLFLDKQNDQLILQQTK